MWTARWSIALTMLGGCGASPPPVASDPPPAARPATRAGMWIGVDAPVGTDPDDDSELPIEIRDQVAIIAEVPYELHLYVVAVAPDGGVRMLWPDASPQLVAPGPFRFPSEGWHQLALGEALAVVAIHPGEDGEFDSVLERVGRASAYRQNGEDIFAHRRVPRLAARAPGKVRRLRDPRAPLALESGGRLRRRIAQPASLRDDHPALQQWRRGKDWWLFALGRPHDPGVTYQRGAVEVAVRITSAKRAIDEQAALIGRLRPHDNVIGWLLKRLRTRPANSSRRPTATSGTTTTRSGR